MNKQKLLASLKPLELQEYQDDDIHVVIYKTQFGNYEFINSIQLKFNDELIGYYSFDKINVVIQEHYNNLILNLFNLED